MDSKTDTADNEEEKVAKDPISWAFYVARECIRYAHCNGARLVNNYDDRDRTVAWLTRVENTFAVQLMASNSVKEADQFGYPKPPPTMTELTAKIKELFSPPKDANE